MAAKLKAATGETVVLPTVLDLKAAAPLAERLLALRGEPVALDASQVEKVGAQCVQILLSAAVTWKNDGAQLSIVDASDGFDAGLTLLGLTRDALIAKDFSA
jgi:chemotaxis protein CheX